MKEQGSHSPALLAYIQYQSHNGILKGSLAGSQNLEPLSFLVALLAYLLSSFYSCPRADGSVTSDSSQSFTQVLERDIGCIRTAASILGRSFAEEDGYPFHSTRICSVNQFRLEASPAIFSYVLSFDDKCFVFSIRLLNECDAFTRNLLRVHLFI